MRSWPTVLGSVVVVVAACGGGGETHRDGALADAGDSETVDAAPGVRPHPLYPALDLDTLPGPGGAASGAYLPPALPTTTRNVTVTTTGTQARADLQAACQTEGTAVEVPSSAGRIGSLDLGNSTDCDISLGEGVIIDQLFLGHLPGPTTAPIQRVRIRGGQIGSVLVDPGSTDIVLDGVIINNAVLPPGARNSTGIYLVNNVARFAVVNSIIRLIAVPAAGGDTDGCAYLAGTSRDIFFANNNVVTDGNHNSWGFRISGGDNFLAVDNTVRVSFHKLVRMNDGPVDYVYVKGGTWMREATLTAGGAELNDTFQQLEDLGTDDVYIHDVAIHLESTQPAGFGATSGPGQVGKLWQARRLHWHAANESVVSDATLTAYQSSCATGATCDYGIGTHQYSYAPPVLPTTAWRSLPAIAIDDPDQQPITD
jgi:hypothetical protein